MARKKRRKSSSTSAASKPVTPAPAPPTGGRRTRAIIVLAALVPACLIAWYFMTLEIPSSELEGLPELPDLTGESALLREAIVTADSAVRRAPDDAEGIGRLATIYHANRFYEPAGAVYTLASRKDPDDYRWYYLHALARAEQADQSEVIPLLEKAVRCRPDDIAVRLKLGEVALKQDQLDLARAAFERILEQTSSSVPASLGLAQVARRQDEWSAVIRYLEPFLQAPPRYRLAHQLLAEAYVGLGRPEEAAAQERILKHAPLIDTLFVADPLAEQLDELCFKADMLLKIIDVAQQRGDFEKMLKMAQRAVRVEPEDADVHHALSRALLLARPDDPGAFSEAMAEHERGLQLRPDDVQPLKHFCQALFMRQRFDIIAPLLERYLSAFPDDSSVYNNLGYALSRIGQIEKAIHYWRMALELQPGDSQARLSLGSTLAAQGQTEEALRVYREGLVEEFHARLANQLAWLLATHPEARLRDGDEAVRLAETACAQTDFLDYRLLDTLAAAYAEAGQFDKAVETAKRALAIAPQDGQTHIQNVENIALRLQKYQAGQPYRAEAGR